MKDEEKNELLPFDILKPSIDAALKEKCLEDLKENETFKKIDAELIDWSKKNPKVIKKETFGVEDIYYGSDKKEKGNKITYAEQQYKKIEELENTLKLPYPFSIEKNITTEELFFRVVDAKTLSKEEALKLANNIIKLLSPVESEE